MARITRKAACLSKHQPLVKLDLRLLENDQPGGDRRSARILLELQIEKCLIRTHKRAAAISGALKNHGIPHLTVEQFGFFRRQEIKDLLARPRLLPNQRLGALQTAQQFSRGTHLILPKARSRFITRSCLTI